MDDLLASLTMTDAEMADLLDSLAFTVEELADLRLELTPAELEALRGISPAELRGLSLP